MNTKLLNIYLVNIDSCWAYPILAINRDAKSISVLDDDTNSTVTIYPVPVREYLDVEISDFDNYSHIEVVDMTGSIIINSSIEGTVTTLAVDHLNNGFYLVLLYQNGTVTKKLRFIK